jgi:hypothetical protein
MQVLKNVSGEVRKNKGKDRDEDEQQHGSGKQFP